MRQPDTGDRFWHDFAQAYWERDRVLLERDEAAHLPQISAAELFAAVAACCADFCRGGHQKVRLYVQGVAIDVLGGSHQALLPAQEDGSFEAYNERIVERAGLPDYALVVADWHQFDRTLWDRILVAAHGLGRAVGISRSRMDTQVFLGTYRATPFGVHTDPTSGFHFPVVGNKTMRFWPDRFAANVPELHHAMNYERFLGESTAITAQPGQVLYWPSTDWHVGESDGRFSVTWGMGYWLGDGMQALALQELGRLLAERPCSAGAASGADEDGIPSSQHGVTELMSRLDACLSDARFRAVLEQGWLEHFSACGYLRVPRMSAEPANSAGRSFTRKPMYPVLLSSEGPGTLRVATGGHSTVVPDRPSVRAIADALSAGHVIDRTRCTADGGAAAADMIDFCFRAGALTALP